MSDPFRLERSEHKTADNIRRAQRMIEAYALCNDWQWFGTFTLNPEYRNRADLDGFRSAFMQLLRDSRKRCGCEVRALLVPELHKNKAGWHMHGLIAGLPVTSLRVFETCEKLPRYIRGKIKAGEPVYDWPEYRRRFGWVDIEPVKHRDAAARYITKYITKAGDNTAQALDKGKHLYYVTRGLKLPERMETENAPGAVPEAFPADLVEGNSYSYDYGQVTWYEAPK